MVLAYKLRAFNLTDESMHPLSSIYFLFGTLERDQIEKFLVAIFASSQNFVRLIDEEDTLKFDNAWILPCYIFYFRFLFLN